MQDCMQFCLFRATPSPIMGVGGSTMTVSTQQKLKKSKKLSVATGKALAASPSAVSVHKSGGSKKLVLRERLGLTRDTFAGMLPVSTRSLADIEAGKHPPSDATARRLTELERLIDALSEVINPAAIGEWLKTPNSAFGGLKPLEVIDRGETDRLWRMIFLLRSGTPS